MKRNKNDSSVQVAVRVRPFLPSEVNTSTCVNVSSSVPTSSQLPKLLSLPSPVKFRSSTTTTTTTTTLTIETQGNNNNNNQPNENTEIILAPTTPKTEKVIYTNQIQIGDSNVGKTFSFDVVYENHCTQKQVYCNSILPLVTACLEGYNATVLAYGQTGSGKTHTILGPSSAASFKGDPDIMDSTTSISSSSPFFRTSSSSINSQGTNTNSSHRAGVIPRALRELFQMLESTQMMCMQQFSNRYGTTSSTTTTTTTNMGSNATTATDPSTASSSSSNETNDPTSSSSSKPKSSHDHQAPFEYEVRVQFLELYGEDIRDLLSPNTSMNKLSIRDGGHDVEAEVIGASEVKVETAEEALLCLTRGQLRRVTGATAMNAESSRSHAIMTVFVEQTKVILDSTTTTASTTSTSTNNNNNNNTTNTTTTTMDTEDANEPFEYESKRSKFHFVDLAGSERQKKSLAEGKRFKEGIEINKGLLVLGNVISALGDPTKRGKTFVPYRDSKLTRLLKGSLGGNHKTLMIACVSPSSSNMEETLNCLRYANRAKNIQNHAVANVDAGSRLINELRAIVQTLAMELLKALPSDAECSVPRKTLTALATGSDHTTQLNGKASPLAITNGKVSNADISSLITKKNSAVLASSTPTKKAGGEEEDDHDVSPPRRKKESKLQKRLEDAREQINLLEETMQRTKKDVSIKDDELMNAAAEKEYYQLQLAEKEQGGSDGVDGNDKTDKGPTSKNVFVKQIAEYKREIAELKQELRTVKASAETQQVQSSIASPSVDEPQSSPRPQSERSARSGRAPSREAHTPDETSSISPSVRGRKKTRPGSSTNAAVNDSKYDQETRAEETALNSMTSKYLKMADDTYGAEEEPEMDAMVGGADVTSQEEGDVEDIFRERAAHLDARLQELSKGIAEKEELVQQLRTSQTKYETMRDFYEDKLGQMGKQLKEREAERHYLLQELTKFAKDSAKFKELKEELTVKERHIALLRDRQKEISNLTKISSRNESIIQRLTSDVKEMKIQKTELEKKLLEQKKEHTKTIQALRKEALTQQRNTAKMKQELNKTIQQKEKLEKINKAKSEEVNKLRSKFRDSDKRVRMQTLKRGVMESAGIDSVMVGRRLTGRRDQKKGGSGQANTANYIDSLQSFFDEKVLEIGRKELTADKLAHEYEDHLELVTRREELLKELDGDDTMNEDIEGIDIQIQFKESRIRQLARSLRKRTANGKDGDVSDSPIIDDYKFKRLCGDLSPLASAQLASKILFGMIVKERRRVATLARAASALDQKAADAEEFAASKEAALRSHMEEARDERTKLAQSQQDKILTLMSLVQAKQNEKLNDSQQIQQNTSTNSDSVVLTLANERIDLLESQLNELQGERESRVNYQEKESDAKNKLSEVEIDQAELHNEMKQLKSTLRKIRQDLSGPPAIGSSPSRASGIPPLYSRASNTNDLAEDTKQNVLKMIQDALDINKPRERDLKSPRRIKTIYEDPISPSHDVGSSSDDESGESPEWADSVMEDLAIIAAGDMPQSLKGSRRRPPMKGNVFERLTDPGNFTGVQKSAFLQLDRNSDQQSVASRRSFSSKVSHSTPRSKRSPSIRGGGAGRRGSFRDASPMSRSSRGGGSIGYMNLDDMKDGQPMSPPMVVSLPAKSRGSFTDAQDQSVDGDGFNSSFIQAYTKKDVFERLQKKVTNSYAMKQAADFDQR